MSQCKISRNNSDEGWEFSTASVDAVVSICKASANRIAGGWRRWDGRMEGE